MLSKEILFYHVLDRLKLIDFIQFSLTCHKYKAMLVEIKCNEATLQDDHWVFGELRFGNSMSVPGYTRYWIRDQDRVIYNHNHYIITWRPSNLNRSEFFTQVLLEAYYNYRKLHGVTCVNCVDCGRLFNIYNLLDSTCKYIVDQHHQCEI